MIDIKARSLQYSSDAAVMNCGNRVLNLKKICVNCKHKNGQYLLKIYKSCMPKAIERTGEPIEGVEYGTNAQGIKGRPYAIIKIIDCEPTTFDGGFSIFPNDCILINRSVGTGIYDIKIEAEFRD